MLTRSTSLMDVSSNSLSWSTTLSENNRNSMIDYGTKRLSDSFMSSHPRKPLSACNKENDRNSARGANDRNSTARGANDRNSTECNSNAARGARVRRAEPIVVCVTGATGQIGYALLPHIADGACFGRTQPIILKLLCTNETTANGVKMELEDLACPLLVDTVVTLDAATAFTGADYAIMVGAAPRGPGMERKDVLEKNVGIFHHQGRVLSEHGKPSCKVVVVGNPANTNAAILAAAAPNLDPRNITCLTRLDHNRAQSMVARRVGCAADEVEGIVTWGNHSATQYPDLRHASVRGEAVVDLIGDDAWVEGEFIKVIQQRGAAIIKARNRSSAASAAKAVVDHLRDWVCGTHNGTVSMGVVSDGSYGVPAGLFYSLPVACANGAWTVRAGLHIDAFSARMMKVTADELEGELAMARAYLATASCEK